MDSMSFTVDEAKMFAEKDDIEEWVHIFLTNEGDNKELSEGLKLQKRYWVGPVLIELKELKRCCGPEPDMEFVQPRDNWERHIERFQKLIQNGWKMPPLIAANVNGTLSVRDGNHRLEALIRENIKKFWVIIWDSNSPENLKKWSDLDY